MPDFLPLHEHAPDPALVALLAEKADVLKPLLGELWPVTHYKLEHFGPLTKYTLGEVEPGVWAMLHRITGPDTGPPHDHPVCFTSYGIKGSYKERRYFPAPGGATITDEVTWAAGSQHIITPECIHLLIELPEDECWTLALAGPVIREWKHYPDLIAAGVREAGRPEMGA